MPLRDYSTKAGYDADYRLFLAGETVPLAPAGFFIDPPNIIRDVFGVWTRPKVGGRFRLSLGEKWLDTLNRSEIKITDINGTPGLGQEVVYTLDNPRPWGQPEFFATERWDQVIYVAPGVWCGYLSAVLRDGTYEVIDAMVAALGMAPPQSVAVIGTGMGWEVERLAALGFNVVGTETSAWVQSAKTIDEGPEVDEALIAAGYDPLVGEGAVQRARMLAEPRAKLPAKILGADVAGVPGQNAVKDALAMARNKSLDWALTIGVMPTLNDAEATALNKGMLKLAANVAHYVTVLPDVADFWNRKTSEQWKALLAPALIVPHGVARAGYTAI